MLVFKDQVGVNVTQTPVMAGLIVKDISSFGKGSEYLLVNYEGDYFLANLDDGYPYAEKVRCKGPVLSSQEWADVCAGDTEDFVEVE